MQIIDAVYFCGSFSEVYSRRLQEAELDPPPVTGFFSLFFFWFQRVGADLQAHVKEEFRALHQILLDEEACPLEQLRREEEEELEKVRRHLEATELAVRELEDGIKALQQASAATENIVLAEVSVREMC